MRFSFGVRQAIGVGLLVLICAAYIVLQQRGESQQLFVPFITTVGAIALLLGSRRRGGACCGRRKGTDANG